MKLISVDALLSIAKDVTLGNGTKHRCIDATQIHELPKREIVLCKDCKKKDEIECPLHRVLEDGTVYSAVNSDFYCGYGKPKDVDAELVIKGTKRNE